MLDEKVAESAMEDPFQEAKETLEESKAIVGRAREEEEYWEREMRSMLGADPKAEEEEQEEAGRVACFGCSWW